MAQELADKIRAAAQAKNIDPDIALAIARAESSLRPEAKAGTSSAGGLFQVVDKTWREFGGNPKKKLDADENIRVGTDIIAKNTQTLKSFLNRDPRPAEVYAAHYFGPSGAKNFLSADPATPIVDILGKSAVKANPNLQGKNVGQVMAQLEKKMGSGPAPTANVSRETPAPREALPPSLPPMAAAPAEPAPSKMASLGPSYQAALALSFLADTDEKEDRDIDREPGVAEKWLAEQAPRPAALAEFANVSIKSPFAAMEPQQPQMLADGGEVGEQSAPDVGRPTVSETQLAKVMFPELPVAEAVYLIRGGQRQSTPQGEMLMGNLGAHVPLGKDSSAMLMLAGSRPEREMTESKALMAAFNKRVGDEGGLNLNVVRPLDAPGGVLAGGLSASYPMGEGRISGNVNALRLPGQDPRITGYGVGYGGRVGPGNLSAQIMKQKEGPYSGQVEYRLPIGRADGGEVTAEELAVASKPAFLTPKSGIGRKISTKTGELESAAMQGVSEAPYLLAGAPVDLATMAMRPFGYNVEKPMFGSEDLKERALKAGIRQKPPEGKAARALYEMTQLGASAVNPAAPVRGAVKAAEKTGEAAKMLARDFQQYNQQLDVPGASYAVRNKGTPVVIDPKRPVTTDDFHSSMSDAELKAFQQRNPDVALYSEQEMAATPEFQAFAAKANAPVDAAEAFVRNDLATTPDSSLNSWFMKALPRYLRSDFASPQDQLVRAAEEGKLLHLAPKKFSTYSDSDVETAKLLVAKGQDVKNMRRTEGFSLQGEAKQPYGEVIESLTDIAAYPEAVGDLTPNRVPPSMRNLVETNPEARVMDFAPDIGGILKLPELRDKMLEIRALGPKAEYSAYGQAPAKVPDEFLLPDDTLAKLNVAAASNRVARFTRWQDETRQAMATTALRSDPGLNRRPLQEGKYIAVALPDVDVHPKYMKLVNDVGCDGGWCTQAEGLAMTYGSGDARLHVIVSGEGKKARPVAQISVEKGVGKDGSTRYGISEIKERGDTTDFLNNPALPAIQEYVQELDNVYGGLRFVSDLKALGMKQLPKNPMELLTLFDGSRARSQLAKAFGSEQEGFGLVRDELIRLNNGSQYTTGNEDAVAGLIDQAVQNVLNPRQRATGGMIERQSTDNRRYL